MVDEKPYKYERPEQLPIPTYEEATSSRPQSAQPGFGPSEISDDAERQGLMRQQDPGGRQSRHGGYRPPTVESTRSSLDDDDVFLSISGDGSVRSSEEGLRREIIQMELEQPDGYGDRTQPSQMRQRLTKSIESLTSTFSSFHLPFRLSLPSFGFLFARVPRMPELPSSVWILLARFFAIFLVMSLIYALFVSQIFPLRNRTSVGQMYDPESVRAFVQGHMDADSIRSYLQHLTSYPHMAGTEGSFVLAQWVEGLFAAAELEDVALHRYDVYLNYPKQGGRRVAIIDPPDLAWEAVIEEENAYENPTPQQQQTPVFHGLSRSGNVTGHLVYANYGSREDFQKLVEFGIDLKGAIVLVRYYGSQGDRGLKVKAAEMAGAVGCIIYSDPAEDGFVKGEPWPHGKWMPSDGVQRGTVGLTSWIAGDVLTPGFASTPNSHFPDGKKRISKDNNPALVNIPSIPVAWRDAQRLLQVLEGHGKELSGDWIGGVPKVNGWWSGDQSSPTVHLMNEQDEVDNQPIYNVVGQITGVEQPEKVIYVGNHRDAWCFGAADPGSGTAVMLEVIRVFGELRQLGWRPRRTIQFNSWDGEEYNLIGSTEYVEDNIEEIRRNGFAYLNVDVAVTGSKFSASGSPIFGNSLLRVLDRTSDPVRNQTLRSLWDESNSKVEGLGAGSDYVAFQDIAGTSSMDFGFDGPGYPYHSCYDNFEWMDEFGDPGFQYHKVLAQVWALMILELAEQPILPFDLSAYARSVKMYANEIKDYAAHAASSFSKGKPARSPQALNFDPLKEAIDIFIRNAEVIHSYEREWTDVVYGGGGYESNILAIKRMSHNTRMANFETHLLDLSEGGGLPGREQYKHIIFAPQIWNGYNEARFPGIRDAIDSGDWDLAQEQINKIGDIIRKASNELLH
ncbi:MAG: hypothetical protein M1827_002831 [Pycnora praestabilis]|nr:MAG: hypothetical protein M1827_002831 [Pycnora praestabilis]